MRQKWEINYPGSRSVFTITDLSNRVWISVANSVNCSPFPLKGYCCNFNTRSFPVTVICIRDIVD